MKLRLFSGTAFLVASMAVGAETGPIDIGSPLGAVNEKGVYTPMSANVKVYGSFHFSESCTYDRERNLIVAMNLGNRENIESNDGYVSLVHPDGRVHTPKWIGTNRDNLILDDPRGSAIVGGVLYVADLSTLRTFDLASGQPRGSIDVPGATMLNGIGVTADGTAYISNTRPEGRIFRVTADGTASVFYEGAPLDAPNGVAIDRDGNIVVVNVNDNAVMTFSPAGKLLATERTVDGGNDGLVITEDGTKYVSSVRFGSVSRLRPGQPAEVIAAGIPSAASMCYDPVQKQLVIPMNPNNALAFIALEADSP